MDDYRTASDDRLVALGRTGDRAAFGELVERHKDALVNYLTRLSGSREQAEDLAQEAFVRLYERGGGYRERGLLRAYLFRIATNLLRSQARRQRRWRAFRSLLPPSNGKPPQRSPQHRLLDHELRRHLAAALLRLPLRYRQPVVLSHLEGWPLREIADLMGCREGTVKSRLHRGRRMLREILTPYVHGERPGTRDARSEGETP